ncbi:MAG TPA: TPM domain-containing protein, partial [Bacteroidia bacterium]|nr:TPM domain-containing protein [Bacteroidia bacterium]
DHDPNEFATELGQEWQIGQKKFDNGVVLLIQPKAHKVFIAVGYGLEGAIPDATCEDIIQREIIPSFKKGDYAKGLNDGVDVIIGLAKGEYNSSDYAKKGGQGSGKALGLIFAIIFFIVFFIFSRRNGGKGGMTIGGPGIFFWGGGFGGGGGSSFGGGGGGFGGGGFGGGGGGFGGGGAGGSW